MRCLFSNLNIEDEIISLANFNENIQHLVDIIPQATATQTISLTDVSPDDLCEALLSMPDVKITYDSVAKKLISVAKIDI